MDKETKDKIRDFLKIPSKEETLAQLVLEQKEPVMMNNWLPILEARGVDIPKTVTVEMPPETLEELFDGGKFSGRSSVFFQELQHAATSLGLTCFLRNGAVSGKHFWRYSCYYTGERPIEDHVYSIAA